MKTRELVSAGGVAFRNVDSRIEIVLIKTAMEGRWQLPKGIIDPGETPEQAALREVGEEAGITCAIVEKIDVIDYWFVDRYSDAPVRTHKFVHFFLMQYLSGDVADHDDEVFEARWVESVEAVKKVSFETERILVATAIASLR